jgi:catechol 2,3-dioxygenase-like lactoylglutathione lyase family enzyme
MGHIVMNVERIDRVLPFYQDLLGFRLSDYTLRPFKAYFLHLNPRHHSFAMIETGVNSVHHVMMELFMLDDVGQAYDLALGEPGRIATTLGRHSNDFMTSFYSRTPSGFFVEYGWGGRSIDPAAHAPVEMTCGPSLWGHDRDWLTLEGRAEARELRLQAARDGLREPVQVMDGNYSLAPGTCGWFDALRKQS